MRSLPPWGIALAGLAFICGGLALGARRGLLHHSPPALTIDAVAHQWWWQFKYPAFGITTTDELHAPSDSVVRFRLTSADIIHTFWMPGMQKAVPVVPGRERVLDLKMKPTGESYGTCDATCGCGAVCMRFRVTTVPRGAFHRWVVRERSSPHDSGAHHANAIPACISTSASYAKK